MNNHAKPPLKAECRCGKLQASIAAAPLITSACHCKGCQKMAASAFSLTVIALSESFSVIAGKPVIGGLHGGARHYFCDYCLSWVFTRPEGFDEIVNIRTTMLEDAADFPPFMETCMAEKLPWAKTGAVRSFDQFPDSAEFTTLLHDYAEWREA
ncbi:GFA family protein [Hyphococcus luteus]|uniref:Aldehyde-activating protein n=1 Tax=Hyphococcus luteus TaxID=2058213 RepID=A0A2S7KAY0_9PROT|nr:GFA family protein [Marinicaulis flavus]PQA89633.1 aldehyde-activating protein [Marinicaulis flavus]